MLTKKKNMLHQAKESLGMSSGPIEWSSYLSLNTILYDVSEYNTSNTRLPVLLCLKSLIKGISNEVS